MVDLPSAVLSRTRGYVLALSDIIGELHWVYAQTHHTFGR